MTLETILLWYSYTSLVFWTGVLIWCIVSLRTKKQEEQEWFQSYKPTLESDISDPDIGSWLTLSEVEQKKKAAARKAAAKKAKAD